MSVNRPFKGAVEKLATQHMQENLEAYGGSGPWKSTFTKDSTTFFKQLTAGSFLYQHVEN